MNKVNKILEKDFLECYKTTITPNDIINQTEYFENKKQPYRGPFRFSSLFALLMVIVVLLTMCIVVKPTDRFRLCLKGQCKHFCELNDEDFDQIYLKDKQIIKKSLNDKISLYIYKIENNTYLSCFTQLGDDAEYLVMMNRCEFKIKSSVLNIFMDGYPRNNLSIKVYEQGSNKSENKIIYQEIVNLY